MIISLSSFALAVAILSVPTIWELWHERKGEAPEHKKISTSLRVLYMVASASIVGMIFSEIYGGSYFEYLFRGLALSFVIFFLFFDYCINLILGRKPWYSYLSKSPIDSVWSKVNWKWRMLVRVIVFVAAMIWFYL